MVKEEKKNLSFEEKLRLIDNEIRILHQFCVAKGYEPDQIEKSAEPLLTAVRQIRRQRVLVTLGKVVLVLAVLIGLYQYDPVYRILCAYGRLASIQVLPYWDWTRLHGSECLVNNPYYIGGRLTEEDCELCEHLEHIDRVHNLSQSVFSEDYIKRDIPVIITDATEGWEAKELFTIPFLHQLYDNELDLRETFPCMFASNVRVRYGNARALLQRANSGDITNWYAHWENCAKPAAKILRQFYRRPYFMHTMVEMAEPNWIFLASRYKGKKNKPADIALPMMWIAQIKGQMKVTLTPRTPCDEFCSTLYGTLHEGDMLVLTDMMWLLDYMPVSSVDTIAVGSGGFFD